MGQKSLMRKSNGLTDGGLSRQGTWSRADYLKVRHEKKGREKILELSHNKKNILAANKSFQTEKAQERKK